MLLASIIMDVKPYKTKIKDFAHLATAPSGPGTERSSKLSQRDGIPMNEKRQDPRASDDQDLRKKRAPE